MKYLVLPFAVLSVSACMQTAPTSSAIQGTQDSLANRLAVGMTPDQVSAIVGPSVTQVRSTINADQICQSVVYDEVIEAKYIHAVYENGVLVSASDGHALPCDLD
ncbi:hypothetical protein [Nereida sp. MMG025]|uniref:hypothetical protein n=1 Tax=Nereida sp. MMG025 TaxID=2909981 RepID=UPI001F418DEE|nr:hypothetical protein [Nereida sp. MMG025]MCF6444712.1 hypothetical protein [Nereida sp. MMG025]